MKNIIKIITLALFIANINAVNIENFTRSNSITYEKLEDGRLTNSHVHSDYNMIFTLGGSWVDSPLVIKDPSNNSQLGEVIKGAWYGHVGVGYYINDDIMIGATSSYVWLDSAAQDNVEGIQDVKAQLKWRIIDGEKYALTLAPHITIPVQDKKIIWQGTNGSVYNPGDDVLSDGGIGFGGIIIYERLFKYFNAVLNLGFNYNQDAIFSSSSTVGGVTSNLQIDKRKAIISGIGAYIPLHDNFGLNIEWSRLWTFPIDDIDNDPNELHLGATAAITKRLHAFAGASVGNLLADDDGNDYRFSTGIKYTPKFGEDRKPIVPVAQIPEPVVQAPVAPVVPQVNCENRFVFGNTNASVIRFPHNMAKISGKYKERLTAVASQINARLDDIEVIEVFGHTSALGSDEYNQALSERRANNVVYFMAQDMGIPASKFRAYGKGEAELLNSLSTRQAHKENRRTEFQVILDSKYSSCN